MPKKYSDEFKSDAVAVYLENPGATYKEIAADLGLNSETLRGWVQQARELVGVEPFVECGRQVR